LALGATPKSRQAAYRQFFTQQLSGEVVTDIRNALNTGLVLGSDRFKEQVRELTGVRQHHLKRGPQSKNTNDSHS
jgi:putative transposase